MDDEIVLLRDDAETACRRRLSVVIVEVLLPLDFISRKIGDPPVHYLSCLRVRPLSLSLDR